MSRKELHVYVDPKGLKVQIPGENMEIPRTAFKDIPENVLVGLGNFLINLESIPYTKRYSGRPYLGVAILNRTHPINIWEWIHENAVRPLKETSLEISGT